MLDPECRIAVHTNIAAPTNDLGCRMALPFDLRNAAKSLRQQARKPGDLAERARMIILAERLERLAEDLENEKVAAASAA